MDSDDARSISTEGVVPAVRPHVDPIEASAVLDAVAGRMFGALPRRATIGRFTLLERVGAGGMGVVYAAYDPQLDRKVALKVILAPGGGFEAASSSRSKRLLREARAAARLNHPHVVAVHEVGIADDRVYLAMEFVDGVTLRVWLEETRTSAEIIDVFALAGEGLLAAHRGGVVHRDFKPENVLVGRNAPRRVCVVDFGLARASIVDDEPAVAMTGETIGEDTTRTGALMGTPAYMAPEQHLGGATDARTDQFAFCVALWEALYRAHPFGGATQAAIAHAVLAGAIVDPPSGRDVPTRVRRVLERGMALAPDRRYPSLAELLADLARDPARTRRRIVTRLGAGAVLVAGGAAVQWSLPDERPCEGAPAAIADTWNDAHREAITTTFMATDRSYAAAARDIVVAALDRQTELWIAAHREACEATLVRREQSDELLDLRMACLDRVRGEMAALIGVLEEGDADTVAAAPRSVEQLASIDACADAEALRAPVPLPDDPDARARIIAVQDELARAEALADLGRFEEAGAIAERCVGLARELDHDPTLADALVALGASHVRRHGNGPAREYLEEAVWTAMAGRNHRVHIRAATSLVTVVGHEAGDLAEGTRWAAHARAVLKSRGDPPAMLAALEGNLGTLSLAKNDRETALQQYSESARLFAEALGEDHFAVGNMLSNVAVVRRQLGDLDGAERDYARAIEILEAKLGPNHPELVSTITNRAAVQLSREQYDAALASFQRALALGEATMRPDHPTLGHAHNNMGVALWGLERNEEAEREFAKAVSIWESSMGPSHPLVGEAVNSLGLSAMKLGRPAEAVAFFERALAIRQAETVPEEKRAETAAELEKAKLAAAADTP